MERSVDRILVTHAGALAKPHELAALVRAREEGESFDPVVLEQAVAATARANVGEQLATGIDFVNDGEPSKGSFNYYVKARLGGVVERVFPPGEGPVRLTANAREYVEFPEYFDARMGDRALERRLFFTTDPLTYVGGDIIEADIRNLKGALEGRTFTDAILPCVAPGSIEHWLRNEYYPSQEDFLFALADAMHEEYRAIVDAGFIVQVDDPDLPHAWGHVYQIDPAWTVKDYQDYAELRVEALNRAIGDIPEDRVIAHFCWGGDRPPSGPHSQDLELEHVIDLMYRVHAQAYSIAAANPRHEWEWEVFKNHPLPDGKILIPGVLTPYSDVVEHPKTVAQRLVRYAEVVGRENVIAGTDCGIGARATHPKIGWAKLEAMVEGARLASDTLWN
jgi:5-methyltetrahydropteroyltriglutamate--homocysteine methyltransferase